MIKVEEFPGVPDEVIHMVVAATVAVANQYALQGGTVEDIAIWRDGNSMKGAACLVSKNPPKTFLEKVINFLTQ